MESHAFDRSNGVGTWRNAGEAHSRCSPSFDARAAQVLSEAGHDLRGMLGGIRATISELASGPRNLSWSHHKPALDEVLVQCDTLLNLSENLLSVERLQSDMVGGWRRWFEPILLEKTLMNGIRATANLKRIDVRWNGFHALQRNLFGDTQVLQRLLGNLLSNAIKASPENSVVEVVLSEGSNPGVAMLEVRDSGRGFGPELFPHVIQRGVSYEGQTGLGLSICQSLAAHLMTPLRVLTKEGGGTRVRFEVACGGIASVATQFLQWRENLLRLTESKESTHGARATSLRDTINLAATGDQDSITPQGSGEFRTDTSHAGNGARQGPHWETMHAENTLPAETLATPEAELLQADFLYEFPVAGGLPRHPGQIMVQLLQLAEAEDDARVTDADTLDLIDRVIQGKQRFHELFYRYDQAGWILLWDSDARETRARRSQIDAELQARFGSRLRWSPPIPYALPSKQKGTCLLEEIMIRVTLQNRLPAGLLPPPADQPRRRSFGIGQRREARRQKQRVVTDIFNPTVVPLLGSPPSGAQSHGHTELERLGAQLRRQSRQLSAQAKRFDLSLGIEPQAEGLDSR